VRKHQDWKDYIAAEGETLSFNHLRELGRAVGIDYLAGRPNSDSDGSDIMQRWYDHQNKSLVAARAIVSTLFGTSIGLLAVPSILTAVKVAMRMIGPLHLSPG
jgi:hypothetical protein